jgi:hypothetical protein
MKLHSLVTKIVVISAFICVICLWLIYSIGMDAIQLNRMGDSAIFEQVVENIWHGKGAVSNVFAATQNFIDRGYVFKPLRILDEIKLEAASAHERDMLSFHAYYILYAIAPLLKFVSSSLALSLIQTFCYFGMLIAASIFIFQETRSKLASFLFLPIIFFSPNWYGGIQGWFYPDRVFLLAGFLLCYLSYRNAQWWLIALFAVFVGLINERAALIGGIVLLYMPFVSFKKDEIKQHWINILIGLALIAYAYIQKTYILSNIYYAGGYLPGSLSEFLSRFLVDGFAKNTVIFMISNLAMIVISFAKPRLAFLSIAIMFLNIAGNVGGAEKVGWTTHYHSYYFPILAFSAAVGFISLNKKYLDKKINLYKTIFFYIVCLMILIMQFTYNLNKGYIPNISRSITPFIVFDDLINNRATGLTIRANIITKFPINASVSTDEAGMALLHNRVSVDYFPVSASTSDYLFIPCSRIQYTDITGNVVGDISKDWLLKNGFYGGNVVRFDSIGKCLLGRFKS